MPWVRASLRGQKVYARAHGDGRLLEENGKVEIRYKPSDGRRYDAMAKKLAALFEFVADDIRYVNYVSGEWWLPNRPQQCLARRQGDCDDKAMLLIALLKSIGVEATPVLVQTRMTAMPSVLMGTKAAAPPRVGAPS